jgi:hypothetical protein
MKRILFAIVFAASIGSSFAEDKGAPAKADPKMDPKMAEMMKAWQEASTPGAAHEVLKGLVGKWKYTSKMWHTPTSAPEESTGTSTMKMIFGGRFLVHETKSKAMGMPFEGIGYTGYNNVTKKYETTWIDSMNTGTMHGTGAFDAATQTLTDSGEFYCPMKKGELQKYRSEWKILDKNNTVYTMYGPDEKGKEFKGMEMTFKRVK